MSLFGKRILVLIPHPDDEVVGCGVALARAVATGARVYGLYLSHGCLARETLWPWQRGSYATFVARRMEEAAVAADFLGLTMVGANFERSAREIWPQLDHAEEEVRQALRECAPDVVWAPAYEGGNPDHDGLNALASTLHGVAVWEFAEYHFANGKAEANSFLAPRDDEIILTLSDEEKAMKRAALKLYKSERGNLSAMKTVQESFRPLKAYDYTRPPHEGPLWYAQHHWVPFQHPRVDFTKPEEVSAAIADFLGER
jgi:LmbE family N-acetylglucosaminyl deacetylase